MGMLRQRIVTIEESEPIATKAARAAERPHPDNAHRESRRCQDYPPQPHQANP
jgi:hypothetical protein